MLTLVDPQQFAKNSEALFDQVELLYRMLDTLRLQNSDLTTINNVVPGQEQLDDRVAMSRGSTAQQKFVAALRAIDRFEMDADVSQHASPSTTLMRPLAMVYQRFNDNVLELKRVTDGN